MRKYEESKQNGILSTIDWLHEVRIIHFILIPFSWLFELVVLMRNWMYDRNMLAIHDVGIPVISVGNLTVGGTGKTPVVIFIADRLMHAGKKVSVVSRGYKRRSNGPVLVSDGKNILTDSKNGGDEPVEIAQRFPGVVIGVDEKRSRIARRIVEEFHPDVMIMDDGFQHRALKRDYDIVIVSARQNPMKTAMLPAGRRRESLHSLKRASMVIITKSENAMMTESLRQHIREFTKAPIAACSFKPVFVHDHSRSINIKLDEVKGKKCVAFCGVGEPESFFQSVIGIGISTTNRVIFSDHHHYTISESEDIIGLGKNNKCDFILTTEKDIAGMDSAVYQILKNRSTLCSLTMTAEFVEGEEVFMNYIQNAIGKNN